MAGLKAGQKETDPTVKTSKQDATGAQLSLGAILPSFPTLPSI